MASATGERAVVRVCLQCLSIQCFCVIYSVHGVCGICHRNACRGEFFLALDSVHGACGTCDRAACSGACLFALDSVHGVCVWHVRQGSVQQCVFVCSANVFV